MTAAGDRAPTPGDGPRPGARLPTIRVAGLLVADGAVLMVEQGRGEERYWLLPGGGVRFGEPLADALKREFREELGLRVGVGGLLAIVESISPQPDYPKHVVHLVFAVSAPSDVDLRVDEAEGVLGAAFLDELALERADVRPPIADFLVACTRHLPRAPQYLGRRW